MKISIISLILFLTLFGCSSKSEEAQLQPEVQVTSKSLPLEEPHLNSMNTRNNAGIENNPDGWLKFFCENVGATYISGKHLCTCEPGKFFKFKIDLNTGNPIAECRSLKIAEDTPELLKLNTEVPRNANLYFLGYQHVDVIKNHLIPISVPTLTATINTFWISNSGILKELLQPKEESPFAPLSQRFHGFVENFFEEDQSFLKEHGDFPHLGGALSIDMVSNRFFIETDFGRLLASLKGITLELPRAQVFWSASLPEELLSLLPQIYKLTEKYDPSGITDSNIEDETLLNTHHSYEAHSKYGCAEYCSFVMTQEVNTQIKYSIRWEKSFLSGAIYQNKISLMNPQGIVVAQLFLTPINDLSMLVVYTYSQTSGSYLVRSERFYDRAGDLIHQREVYEENPYKIDDPSNQKTDLSGFAKSVICEQDFPTNQSTQNRFYTDAFIAGPKPESSFFGWLDNPNGNAMNYWAGTALHNFYAPGTWTSVGAPHHEYVSRAYLESGGEKIIPIGTYDCIYNHEQWAKNVERSETKVVNLSHIFSYDSSACDQFPLSRAIRNSNLLWIGGAGNGGESVTRAQSYGCPNNLGIIPNLIIVVAGTHHGESIAEIATYGEDVADIVADGSHPSEWGKYAASFAAPRVSAAAATLNKEFKTLSVKQIRLAILLGVSIQRDGHNYSKNRFLKVRSGGSLDIGRSKKIAQWLTFKSNILDSNKSTLDLLNKVHCNQFTIDYNNCLNRSKERLDRLITFGILKF